MNAEELLVFLEKVNTSFPVALSEKTSLAAYAQKLIDRADLVEYRQGGALEGLVAGYIRNGIDDKAYISVAALLPEARGMGIGTKMVREFIARASSAGKSAVHLYAVSSNVKAMRMYEKLGFEEWHPENEPRPNDVHLIYYIERQCE